MTPRRPFSLIELLAVAATVAVLAVVLVPFFVGARAQSQVAASKANMKNLATVMESYFNDNNVYPTVLESLSPNYLKVIPTDPCTNLNYSYNPTGSPPTNYTLTTQSWANTPCGRIASSLTYTPDGGLVQR